MSNVKPIITEKTTNLAKSGKYTFEVGFGLTKNKIKDLVGKIFGVNVIGVRTINMHGEEKRSFSRKKRVIKPTKKAIVWLKDKQKIDIFESKKK